jgi:hypothetical protein
LIIIFEIQNLILKFNTGIGTAAVIFKHSHSSPNNLLNTSNSPHNLLHHQMSVVTPPSQQQQQQLLN